MFVGFVTNIRYVSTVSTVSIVSTVELVLASSVMGGYRISKTGSSLGKD